MVRTISRAGLLLCVVALATGCAGPADRAGPAPPVKRLASPNPGSVNAYWVAAPQGLVVIDSGRNAAGGRQVVQEIRRAAAPVVAILITHSHPDHVGGLGALHEAFPSAPIYASDATATVMRTDPLGFYPLARRDDPDFPARITLPDRTFGPDEPLDVGGIRWETAAFGPGESEAATVYYQPAAGDLFSGDLTSNHATPALLEGRTCPWLTNLPRLAQRFPAATTIYPGHGEPAPSVEQIDAQRAYLQTVRALTRPAVAATSPDGPALSPSELVAIVTEVDRRYPDHPPVAALPTLKQANVVAVARELTTENTATEDPACR